MPGSVYAFAAVIGVVALLRLGELLVSARRRRQAPHAPVAEPVVFPLMVALHAGLLVGPLAEVVLLERPFLPALAAGAGAVLLLATALRVWTLSTLGRAWNVRVLAPGAVVTHGPYRWIRHPNYLVVILELAAIPLLHTAWISALSLSALNALVLTLRIRTEERTLAQDPAWVAAMAPKARFLPGLF
ncbi:MAG: isoprenylcysteine carboxylmethyltransferase family protein [Planctomycetota bacterium]